MSELMPKHLTTGRRSRIGSRFVSADAHPPRRDATIVIGANATLTERVTDDVQTCGADLCWCQIVDENLVRLDEGGVRHRSGHGGPDAQREIRGASNSLDRLREGLVRSSGGVAGKSYRDRGRTAPVGRRAVCCG